MSGAPTEPFTEATCPACGVRSLAVGAGLHCPICGCVKAEFYRLTLWLWPRGAK
jgi:rubrerythrin